MDSFGERVKSLRKSKGLTQAQLAIILGIKERMLRHYEKGGHKPDYEGLIKIADFFGVSLDYLTGRTDNPHPYPGDVPPAAGDDGI